jgi:hypothetical protein
MRYTVEVLHLDTFGQDGLPEFRVEVAYQGQDAVRAVEVLYWYRATENVWITAEPLEAAR